MADALLEARDLAALNARHEGGSSLRLIRELLEENRSARICAVSGFGAGSAVLLHLVSRIDPGLPVLFVDTGKLFPATHRHRAELVEALGLRDVRTVSADAGAIARGNSGGALWMRDRDACCDLRKVEPFRAAVSDFDIWISGRKRYQGAGRETLPLFEADGPRLKVNPLAFWTGGDIDVYCAAFSLPRHELLAQGYRSIGCEPCTTPVREGEDERAGRWRGLTKSECGIHIPQTPPIAAEGSAS
jgi:phosphoadenosine phosphosulfate reductase